MLYDDLVNTLYSPVPLPATEVARRLVRKGIYRTRNASVLAYRIKDKLENLVMSGYVLAYVPGSPGWVQARGLAAHFLSIKPRNTPKLYQSNFLYPAQKLFPRPDPLLNLSAMVFIYKYGVDPMELVNFILCGSDRETHNEIRLFLYKQHLDYSDITLLERLLEFNQTSVPFKPDVERAKQMLSHLNTGIKGGGSLRKLT